MGEFEGGERGCCCEERGWELRIGKFWSGEELEWQMPPAL
jgi:hypothetical protein